jgi:hypothetical protein
LPLVEEMVERIDAAIKEPPPPPPARPVRPGYRA